MRACLTLCGLLCGALGAASTFADESSPAWRPVEIPTAWRKKPAGGEDYSWYRTWVRLPERWGGAAAVLHWESADHAAEVFLGGKKLGTLGSLPPDYRSGLGSLAELPLTLQRDWGGTEQLLAVRIYQPSNSRDNLNLAPPLLVVGEEAISLRGTWQSRPGDDLSWGRAEPRPAEGPLFNETAPAREALAAWRKLPGEEGRLTPAESLARLKAADDLAVELVLSEPEIAQPLSMKFDDRGRLWVMEYRQYPDPAGLKPLGRDRFLRTTYDRVPAAPPHHDRGADRISIHEDTNGDGRFDRHSLFLDGLNLATSFEFDAHGLWVLQPPYLLFYPDRDHDDRPDADPEVRLEGFGLEDSHSLVNSLRFGPDGWLYGCQGSTVSGAVRPPGLSSAEQERATVHSQGQHVWRYHPALRKYEVFAEGGGNTFGLEFDSAGRVFSGHNGGDTRGFHYVQGGYYRKGFDKHGPLSNPFTFGYFPSMAHHAVPRFTHTMVLYEAAALPEGYRGKLFSVAPLQGQVIVSERLPEGSTFRTRDLGLALSSNDPWFRPVDIQLGPEGSLYVADFHEQKIDHASHYQGRVAADSGRIYRLVPKQPANRGETSPLPPRDAPTAALLKELAQENRWRRTSAARRLAWSEAEGVSSRLRETVLAPDGEPALEALWILARRGDFVNDPELVRGVLAHREPHVRGWGIRLLGDAAAIDGPTAERLLELAGAENNAEVLVQLAATARRLPADQARPLLDRLCRRAEFAADPFFPLMVWWGIERQLSRDLEAETAHWLESDLWGEELVRGQLTTRLARRLALGATQRELAALARLFRGAPNDDARRLLRAGVEEAYRDRPWPVLPEELVAALRAAGADSLALRLRQGEPAAVAEALERIGAKPTPPAERRQLLDWVAQSRAAEALPPLLKLARAGSPEQRAELLRTLGAFEDPAVYQAAIEAAAAEQPALREAGLAVLAARPAWSLRLLEVIEKKQLAAEAVPPTLRSRMRLHEEPALREALDRLWPEENAEDDRAPAAAEVQRLLAALEAGTGNPYEGRTLYTERCGKCHQLFGAGGGIGPDLTSYQRTDVERLLLSIIAPSLELREGYEQHLAVDENGRLITGLLLDQDPRTVILRTAEGETVSLQREALEELRVLPTSLMPAGLLADLSPQALRDLVAYLRSSQPLP